MAASTNGKRSLVAVVGAAVAATLMAFLPPREGEVDHTYLDPVGIRTACVGHTGAELRPGQTFTHLECQEMLAADLAKHAQGVKDCVTVPLSDGELAAFTSFAFNVGVRAFCDSTLARLANAGNRAGACAELSKWVKAKGRTLPGLVRRRADERALCERDLK